MSKPKKNPKALFLDRDGVINLDTGYTHKVTDLKFRPGVIPFLLEQQKHYHLIVITNQSGVARGFYSLLDVEAFHSEMAHRLANEGVHIQGFFTCPHLPESKLPWFQKTCDCRKPLPGLIKRADALLGPFALEESVVLGDRERDIECGQALGLKGIQIMGGADATPSQKADLIAKDFSDLAGPIPRLFSFV